MAGNNWSKGVTNRQIAFCRQVEAAGLDTYSQAVKAFQRNETGRIKAWEEALAKLEQATPEHVKEADVIRNVDVAFGQIRDNAAAFRMWESNLAWRCDWIDCWQDAAWRRILLREADRAYGEQEEEWR